MLARQQVQGPRRQQGPLLRHRLLHGRARPERRRQARADRVPEDVLSRESPRLRQVARRRRRPPGRACLAAQPTAERRLRRRRLGRRRRHGGGAARRSRLLGARPRGGRRSARRPTSAELRRARPFIRSPPRTPAMRWDFFVRHYADAAQQARDPKFVRRSATASGIRAPARSAAARRTTR